jgi:uncharacterized membrane protein YoaK (UPF0700 family)
VDQHSYVGYRGDDTRSPGLSATIMTFVREIAGPERTPRRNVQLAVVLTLVAGIINSVGFVAVAVYTSHMTGLTATFADHLVLGGVRVAALAATGVICFGAGSMACAIVFNWARRRHLNSRYANVLVLEAILILAFGSIAGILGGKPGDFLVVSVLCLSMGLQNAIITKISDAQIRTTHVTGMVTDVGIELGKLIYRNRSTGYGPPVVADRKKLAMLSLLISTFILGGIIGTGGYLALGYWVVVPTATMLLALSIGPLVTPNSANAVA